MPISVSLDNKNHLVEDNSIFIPNPYRILHKKDHEKTLRTVSKDFPIDRILKASSQLFFDQLHQAMLSEELPDGWMHAGVSAIQVGEPYNIFYAYNGNSDDYELFINPEVDLLGDATDVKDESCLSVPEVIGPVRRFKRVRVQYFDRKGEKKMKKFSGWNARVIQHEFDHTRGILFIDKLEE